MTRKLTAGHGSLGRYGARFCLSLVVALLVALPWPARADYVPQRGDVLDILVSGVPALSQRLAVDSDGKIVFPILGEVEAADLPLTELSRRLQDLLERGPTRGRRRLRGRVPPHIPRWRRA